MFWWALLNISHIFRFHSFISPWGDIVVSRPRSVGRTLELGVTELASNFAVTLVVKLDTVLVKCKWPPSRDECLVSRDERLVSRNIRLIWLDEKIMSCPHGFVSRDKYTVQYAWMEYNVTVKQFVRLMRWKTICYWVFFYDFRSALFCETKTKTICWEKMASRWKHRIELVLLWTLLPWIVGHHTNMFPLYNKICFFQDNSSNF